MACDYVATYFDYSYCMDWLMTGIKSYEIDSKLHFENTMNFKLTKWWHHMHGYVMHQWKLCTSENILFYWKGIVNITH